MRTAPRRAAQLAVVFVVGLGLPAHASEGRRQALLRRLSAREAAGDLGAAECRLLRNLERSAAIRSGYSGGAGTTAPRTSSAEAPPRVLTSGAVIQWPDNFLPPDVSIDLGARALKRKVRRKAAALRRTDLTPAAKVERVKQIVNDCLEHPGNVAKVSLGDGPLRKYWRVSLGHTKDARPISLSRYVELGEGMCPIKAIVAQVALEDAGLEARIRQLVVRRDGGDNPYHFVNEVKIGNRWVAHDFTNPQQPSLNGRRLDQLSWPDGSSLERVRSSDPQHFRIVAPRDYRGQRRHASVLEYVGETLSR